MRNFTSFLFKHAVESPDKPALYIPDYSTGKEVLIKEKVTYGELAREIKKYALALENSGMQAGDRVILLLPVSVDLYALVLASMAVGIIPVLINPRLSKSAFFHCIRQVQAKGIISNHFLLKISWLIPVLRRIPLKFSLAGSFPGIRNLKKAASNTSTNFFQLKALSPEHTALITFTSGSSGLPKGVNRTHSNLINQHLALKAEFAPLAQQIDMPAFPVLTLHNLCCGISTVMPLVRFKNIAQVNVPLLLEQMKTFSINTLSGPPAYLRCIIDYCLKEEIVLPQIQGVAVGGAPVEVILCEQLLQVFPQATTYIVYGSSEAEPIASIDFQSYIKTKAQHHLGFCVGYQAQSVYVNFLPVERENGKTFAYWEDNLCSSGESGEIIVSGEHVCKHYFENPEADQKYKLRDRQGNIWHCTGDIGFKDMQGRIWLLGRRENGFVINGQTYYPFPIERMVHNLWDFRRTAVVAVRGQLVVCLEGKMIHPEIEGQIREHLQNYFNFQDIHVLYFNNLPVDDRHQSKINYPLVRKWAEEKLTR